jgi:hypothetical protein
MKVSNLAVFKVAKARVKFLILLILLLASTFVVGSYAALQTQSMHLEIKEPLEILAYNSSLSLYPGEIQQFILKVENHASVCYNASIVFALNDTRYQQDYMSFSNEIYEVAPGVNTLYAWLSVSERAPAAEVDLSIGITRDMVASLNPTPPPTSSPSSIDASMVLFGAGVKWAANGGQSVLYVNWYDNYCAHNLSNPSWGPYWREGELEQVKNRTIEVLEQQGFKVTCVGDVPRDLAGYSVVLFEAWFAIEPAHVELVGDYLANGGNVVITGCAPCYFSTYCRNLWPYQTGGENLLALQDWFGSAQFVNSGGTAKLVVDKPFGTNLNHDSTIYNIDGYGCYALTSMSSDAQIIARWLNGPVYAFTHEFGNGRIYYQAEMEW